MTHPGDLRFYVELDVFSGRPNPVWPLTSDESLELSARIARLQTGGADAARRLGYRGFIVYRVVRDVSQRWLQVGQGTVIIDGDNERRLYRDTGNIEGWLREQAVARGFGALLSGAA